jgi:hypothetical protein
MFTHPERGQPESSREYPRPEGAVVTDVVEEFFDTLARRGFEPVLRQVSGAVRCDLVDGPHTDRWLVLIDRGHVRVSHDDAPADCLVRTDKETFGRIVTGQVNPLVAVLRGWAMFEGNEELILALQRLPPGPTGPTGPTGDRPGTDRGPR